MAILLEQQKKKLDWFSLGVTSFIVFAIIFGIYFLFFAPTPGIEIVIPTSLKSADQISAIRVDPSTVLNSREFRSLRSYTGLPSVGQVGRDNPFLPF
jgi:hypothetical protein